MMGPECRALVKFLETRRWPLSDETRLQECVADELTRSAYVFEREVRLAKGDIIDFMVGSIGIELKIAGQRRAIYRQCERYCAHDRVQALILGTSAAMGLPESINERPVFVALLGIGSL